MRSPRLTRVALTERQAQARAPVGLHQLLEVDLGADLEIAQRAVQEPGRPTLRHVDLSRRPRRQARPRQALAGRERRKAGNDGAAIDSVERKRREDPVSAMMRISVGRRDHRLACLGQQPTADRFTSRSALRGRLNRIAAQHDFSPRMPPGAFQRKVTRMSEAQAMFALLRQSADPAVGRRHRAAGPGGARPRAQPHQRARLRRRARARRGARRSPPSCMRRGIGMFDLSWNVLCPGCGGVLDANATLKTVPADDYSCALCAADYEPTLDEMVEVTFTVSPRVRRIAAHNPHDAAAGRIFPPDLFRLRARSAGRFRGGVRGDHAGIARAAGRARRRSSRCSCRPSSSSSSTR